MKRRKLGTSSLEISEISFGCMSLGSDEKLNTGLIEGAIEGGINFFDTADLYDKGRNEMVVGKILKPHRSKVILATKVGNQWRPDGSGWDWNPRKEYILSEVEASLRRLQTDYIDLYQLHGGTIDDPMDESIEAFEQLREQGKIRYYGISSIRPNVIRQYSIRSSIVSVMMQYSLLDRRAEESCFPLLLEKNIGVLVRGSLAQGLLVGKDAKPYLNYTEKEVSQAAKAVLDVSNERRGPVQTMLRYVLRQPVIASAVVGIRTERQLKDALLAGTSEDLTPEELQLLDNILQPNRYEQHR